MIQNLSQFKKWLEVGKEIKFIKNIVTPKNAGMTRKITGVQTNGIWTDLDDKKVWLDMPKAKDIIIKDGQINFLFEFIRKNDEDYLERLKNMPNMQDKYEEALQRVKERKQELLDDGAEFIDDNRYVWLVIEPVM